MRRRRSSSTKNGLPSARATISARSSRWQLVDPEQPVDELAALRIGQRVGGRWRWRPRWRRNRGASPRTRAAHVSTSRMAPWARVAMCDRRASILAVGPVEVLDHQGAPVPVERARRQSAATLRTPSASATSAGVRPSVCPARDRCRRSAPAPRPSRQHLAPAGPVGRGSLRTRSPRRAVAASSWSASEVPVALRSHWVAPRSDPLPRGEAPTAEDGHRRGGPSTRAMSSRTRRLFPIPALP